MNKFFKYLNLFMITVIVISINGCCWPAFTSCKGDISICQSGRKSFEDEVSSKYILVSLWRFPSVNNSDRKICINEIVMTEQNRIDVFFPCKAYWVVCTPVLGPQHLAPEPIIFVFNENHFPSWSYGITPENNLGLSYRKPAKKRKFKLVLSNFDIIMPNRSVDALMFQELLTKKKVLMKKMDQCKGLTNSDKEMVLAKLEQIANELKL